nr:MAG TPA: hypothetical protein [Bacteriophage sp.]
MKEHPVHWSDLVYRVFLPSLYFVPFSTSTRCRYTPFSQSTLEYRSWYSRDV